MPLAGLQAPRPAPADQASAPPKGPGCPSVPRLAGPMSFLLADSVFWLMMRSQAPALPRCPLAPSTSFCRTDRRPFLERFRPLTAAALTPVVVVPSLDSVSPLGDPRCRASRVQPRGPRVTARLLPRGSAPYWPLTATAESVQLRRSLPARPAPHCSRGSRHPPSRPRFPTSPPARADYPWTGLHLRSPQGYPSSGSEAAARMRLSPQVPR